MGPSCLAFLGVFALAAAGCAASPPAGPAGEAQAPAWRADCTLGASEPDPWPQACLARVTHNPFTKAETWLGVNPADARNVVAAAKDMDPEFSNGCVWTRLAVTKDGGGTWTELTIGGAFADRGPASPFFGYACNTDPMFGFAKDGTLHYLLEAYGVGASPNTLVAGGVTMFLVTSHDGGLTWPDVLPILQGDGYLLSPDHPWLVVNPKSGTVHVAFLDYIGGSRCYVVNVRGGQAETVVLPVPGSVGCHQAAVLLDGTLVVSGDAAVAGPASGGQWFAASRDDGRTFSTPTAGFSTAAMAYLSADPRPANGTLYAVAEDGGRVLLRSSKDAGSAWTDPVVVHSSAGKATLPRLVVAPDGTLHAFFLDSGHDPAHLLLDATHAWSTDGGRTWATERLSTKPWDPQLARHQNGDAGWVGDYLGADAGPDAVWATFPDASLGEAPSLAVARIVRR